MFPFSYRLSFIVYHLEKSAGALFSLLLCVVPCAAALGERLSGHFAAHAVLDGDGLHGGGCSQAEGCTVQGALSRRHTTVRGVATLNHLREPNGRSLGIKPPFYRLRIKTAIFVPGLAFKVSQRTEHSFLGATIPSERKLFTKAITIIYNIYIIYNSIFKLPPNIRS